jgi:hypothetical protein
MVTDVERRELYQALETTLGEGPARVMMELLPPIGWSDVARQSDLVAVRGEMAELRGDVRTEMAALRTELKGEMGDLRTELKSEMADLRTELKSEMADLRTEVHAQLPRFVLANVPLMLGVAGLVLAAAKLA